MTNVDRIVVFENTFDDEVVPTGTEINNDAYINVISLVIYGAILYATYILIREIRIAY